MARTATQRPRAASRLMREGRRGRAGYGRDPPASARSAPSLRRWYWVPTARRDGSTSEPARRQDAIRGRSRRRRAPRRTSEKLARRRRHRPMHRRRVSPARSLKALRQPGSQRREAGASPRPVRPPRPGRIPIRGGASASRYQHQDQARSLLKAGPPRAQRQSATLGGRVRSPPANGLRYQPGCPTLQATECDGTSSSGD